MAMAAMPKALPTSSFASSLCTSRRLLDTCKSLAQLHQVVNIYGIRAHCDVGRGADVSISGGGGLTKGSFEEDGGIWVGRRGAMFAAAVSTAMHLFSVENSQAAETGGFMSKYLKRKKLDPLDTYVPTVVLAQLQFQDLGGKLTEEKPIFVDVRSLLRSGPAGSLRNDIRAVAQYAAEAGEGKAATEAVDQCLSALEDLDSLLMRASRSDASASLDLMKTRVLTAVTSLDKLLATVPSSTLEKGKAIAIAYRDQSVTGSDDNIGYDEGPDQLKGLL